jgi:hypothetical protein
LYARRGPVAVVPAVKVEGFWEVDVLMRGDVAAGCDREEEFSVPS